MKSVLVALHMVACQPNLLICTNMSDPLRRWADMAHCEADRTNEIDRVRTIIPETHVVMARCRYLIDRDRRSIPAF